MEITLSTPSVAELDEVLAALRSWQTDDAPWQLHPGDIGWHWRLGAQETAAAVRTWSSVGRNTDGRLLAVGLLDGPGLVRVAVDPAAGQDEDLARNVAQDIGDPARGLLPGGEAAVEAPAGTLVRDALLGTGWVEGDPWTPLHLDLKDPVPEADLRIEVIGPDGAEVWSAVLGAAFGSTAASAQRWHTMAAGPMGTDARSLVGYDGQGGPDGRGEAVAAVTVWSAGPGRPGLIEPLGAHPEHRGHGHGRAITLAALAALRDVGSSSVRVCTPRSNTAGVAAYLSAGFAELGDVPDLVRPA